MGQAKHDHLAFQEQRSERALEELRLENERLREQGAELRRCLNDAEHRLMHAEQRLELRAGKRVLKECVLGGDTIMAVWWPGTVSGVDGNKVTVVLDRWPHGDAPEVIHTTAQRLAILP